MLNLPYYRTVPAAALGHKMLDNTCLHCKCVEGSYNSHLGCGDTTGSQLMSVESLRVGKHAYTFFYRNRLVGWKYRDEPVNEDYLAQKSQD